MSVSKSLAFDTPQLHAPVRVTYKQETCTGVVVHINTPHLDDRATQQPTLVDQYAQRDHTRRFPNQAASPAPDTWTSYDVAINHTSIVLRRLKRLELQLILD
jgi:hypothetical protein